MRNRLSKLAGAFLGTLIVLSLLPMIPAFAAQPNVYLDPSHVSYTTAAPPPDKKFNVTALVSGVTDLFGFQVALYYNASIINMIDAWLPADYVFADQPGMPAAPKFGYFDSWGVGFIGFSGLKGETTPFSGDGKLAVFEFEMIASPPKWGSVTSDLVISYKPTGGMYETILYDTRGEPMISTATDGDYIYEWAPPTVNPWLSVDPDPVLKDEYTNWTDTKFTIDIVLNDLEVAWELVSVSFNKTFDPDLLELVSVTEGDFLAGFGATTFKSVVYDDRVFINCSLDTPYPSAFPEGTGVIATIEFKIIFQGEYGDDRSCDLGFENIIMLDKEGFEITQNPAVPGTYIIKGYMAMAAPWLEAEDVTGWSIGSVIDVDVRVKGLDVRWELAALQFRLTYDPEILEVVEVVEGSFLPTFGDTIPMSYDFPTGNADPWTDPHVMFGDVLQPPWTVFPEGEGLIATVRFVLKQYTATPDDVIVELNFIQILFKDQYNEDIPVDWGKVKDGTATILGWSLAGRVIDLHTQYPAPYGGQGPDQPSDMFWPQTEVDLYAEVAYNWKPVQQKAVSYEIRDPHGNLWTTLVGITNETGIALVKFRIPWPCDNPEDLFGVWTVVATVNVAEVLITDTLSFHFDYLVNIWSVTPKLCQSIDNILVSVDLSADPKNLHISFDVEEEEETFLVVFMDTKEGGTIYDYGDTGSEIRADYEIVDPAVFGPSPPWSGWYLAKWLTVEERMAKGASEGIAPGWSEPSEYAHSMGRDWNAWECEGFEAEKSRTDGYTHYEFTIPLECIGYDPEYGLNLLEMTGAGFGDWVSQTTRSKTCEYITVTIEYGTHAMQTYPAVFTVVIHDELNVPIGSFTVEMTVGGAEYCTYKNGTFSVEIHIPKFAFAGTATIHANCLSALPSDGGSAWCPEETATFVIYPW